MTPRLTELFKIVERHESVELVGKLSQAGQGETIGPKDREQPRPSSDIEKPQTTMANVFANEKAEEFDPKELSLGIEREKEHTDDPKEQEKIAKDHLKEDPKYYSRLQACMPEDASYPHRANNCGSDEVGED